MAFLGCMGSRSQEALLKAVEEAVKENSHSRLRGLLGDDIGLNAAVIDRKHLLHQAAWLGYPRCVQLLLENGANPDKHHRKNGCTPLHLAHFCTVEETNPKPTIEALLSFGASVNNLGSHKCGKHAIDHAIQHQRLDSLEILLAANSTVLLQSLLIAIDVANPQIAELLLNAGGQCGRMLENVLYWGQPLHRVLYSPRKEPKQCYKEMVKLFVQASLCKPIPQVTASSEPSTQMSNQHLMIESELRMMSRDYVDLAHYVFGYLLRNGFQPSDSIKTFMTHIGEIEWMDNYLCQPVNLRDLCIRVVRSYTYLSGNVIYGVSKLSLPQRIQDLILLYNPL